MTHTLIYPHTTVHNAAGHLEIGGCDVVDLAREFGTPLFIYDEQTLRDQCRAYHAAFGARTDLYEIVYASKAFSCRAMAELVAQEDLSLDVATGGELAAARAAGFPPERIYFHGNNKSAAEIEAGLDAGIGHFVVDSFEEIERLEAAAAARGRSQDVLVRVTPGVRPNTHDFIQTGQQDSKFGFGLADGRAHEAVRRLKDAPHLELVGVHAHIGSQIFELDSYQREVEVLFVAIDDWRRDFGFECRIFNIGGGLGIRYTSADQPSSIAEFAEIAVGAVRAGAEKHGMPMPRLFVEPGRSIAGKAARDRVHRGDRQGHPRRAHLRGRGRRHERQPAAHALRLQVRGDAGEQGGGGGDGRGHHRRQALRVRRRAGARRAHRAARARRHPRHAEHRRLRLRDGQQLQRAAAPGRGPGRRAAAARVIIERETWDDVLRLQRPLVP